MTSFKRFKLTPVLTKRIRYQDIVINFPTTRYRGQWKN